MKKTVLLAALLLFAVAVNAQKIKGDVSALKNVQQVNLKIDYSEMNVNGKTAEKYVADETNVRKAKSETEADEWLDDWNNKIPVANYEYLVSEFDKHKSDKVFAVGDFPDAEYTIIVKVKDLKTGYFAGPVSTRAGVFADCSITKTGTAEILAIVNGKFASDTSAYVPMMKTRIAKAFGRVGGELGELFAKQFKK